MIDWWMILVFIAIAVFFFHTAFNDFNKAIIAFPIGVIFIGFSLILFVIKLFN